MSQLLRELRETQYYHQMREDILVCEVIPSGCLCSPCRSFSYRVWMSGLLAVCVGIVLGTIFVGAIGFWSRRSVLGVEERMSMPQNVRLSQGFVRSTLGVGSMNVFWETVFTPSEPSDGTSFLPLLPTMNRTTDEAVRVSLQVDSMVGPRLVLKIPEVPSGRIRVQKDSHDSTGPTLDEVPSLSPLESTWMEDIKIRMAAHFPSVSGFLWRRVELCVRKWVLCWRDLRPVWDRYGKWEEGVRLFARGKSSPVLRNRVPEDHSLETRKARVQPNIPLVIPSTSVPSSEPLPPVRQTERAEKIDRPAVAKAPVPRANPSVLKYLRDIKVVSVRLDGTQSKVRIGNEIFYVQSMVSPELKLKLVGIGSQELIFVDRDNVRYTKRISFE